MLHGSTPAIQRVNKPPRMPVLQDKYDKKTIASVSGGYELTMTPIYTTRWDYGGDYVLKHGGRVVWQKQFPFFLGDLVVGSRGAIIGSVDGTKTFEIWHISSFGVPKLFRSYPRKPSGESAVPITDFIVAYDKANEALLSVDGLPGKDGRRDYVTRYFLFDLQSGKLLKQVSEPKFLADRFYAEFSSIKGASAVAFTCQGYDHTMSVGLLDAQLRVVSSKVVLRGISWWGDWPDPPLDADDKTTFLSEDQPLRFAVWVKFQKVTFKIFKSKGTWAMREIGRKAHDPRIYRRAAIESSPVVSLPISRRVKLSYAHPTRLDSFGMTCSNAGDIFVSDTPSEQFFAFDSNGVETWRWVATDPEAYDDHLETRDRSGSFLFGNLKGFFVLSEKGQLIREWKVPERWGIGPRIFEAGQGRTWVCTLGGMYLVGADGAVVEHFTRRMDGGIAGFTEEFAASADGSICMVCRPQPGGMALPGDPAHLCFYDPRGKQLGCIRMPYGNKFSLEGFDGKRVYLSARQEFICFDLVGNPLWRAKTKLFADAGPHCITSDGKYLLFASGDHITFYSLAALKG